MPATVDDIQAFPQRCACTHRLDVYPGPLELRLPMAGFIRGAGQARGYLGTEPEPEPFISGLTLPLPTGSTIMPDRVSQQSRAVNGL